MERWTDVGPLLEAARADLKVGELLAGEAFSLFEAMSALEAGNPKMDAAASPSAERPTLDALLADPNVAPWGLPAKNLLAVLDQLLAMEASWHCGGSAMQTVYACLYMLKLDRAQQHDSPVARALYAYCRTLQYDCALVRDLVMAGAVCEEEDINVFTGGIPFEPPADGAAAALASLDAAIATAVVDAAAAAANGGGGSGASSNGSSTAGPSLGEGLALRLRLRRALHLGLKLAASKDPQEFGGAAAHLQEALTLLPRIRDSAAAVTVAAAASPSPAASSSSSSTPAAAASDAPAVASTSSPASTAASPAAAAATAAALESLGFQIDVNRHLLGPAPPRQVKLMPISEALSYFERMAEHLQLAVSVPEHVHDYRSLQLFLWRFARLRPGAVARSAMHALILPDRWQGAAAAAAVASSGGEGEGAAAAAADRGGRGGGGGGGRKGGGGGGRKGGGGGGRKGQGPASGGGGGASTSQQAAAAAATTPAWVPSKEMIAGACRVQYKAGLPEEAELFFEQALIAASNVFQAMLMNRCRSRRRLRRCLDDWLNMYHHGFNADVVPAFREVLRAGGWRWPKPLEGQAPEDEQGPLATWVEIQTALTMLHHLMMGFELELYEPLEYDMIYWYCDYLCTCAVGAYSTILQRCPPPKAPQPPPAQQTPPGGAGLGRGLGRGRGAGGGAGSRADFAAAAVAAAAAMAKYEREQTQLRYEVCEVEAMQQMCQGMLRLMAGMRLADAVPGHRSPPPFNGGEQRFEQRFASFSPLVRPPPLTHSDYLASMDPGGRDATYLMTLAGTSFKETRLRCAALKAFAPHPDVAAGWVRGLERVAATNAVVAGVLSAKLAGAGAGAEGAAKLNWDCDWSLHPYFPAVSLPKPAPPSAHAASSSATSSAAAAASTASAAPAAAANSG